jgi:hypothetical protein
MQDERFATQDSRISGMLQNLEKADNNLAVDIKRVEPQPAKAIFASLITCN